MKTLVLLTVALSLTGCAWFQNEIAKIPKPTVPVCGIVGDVRINYDPTNGTTVFIPPTAPTAEALPPARKY